MDPMKLPGTTILLTGVIIAGILLFSRCMDSAPHDPRGKAYAGSATCIKCHGSIAGSYGHTPHFHAAALASLHSIEGSFSKDSNTFVVNDTTRVVMEEREGAPYQVLYVNGKATRAERFDIVFGYEKGQAYLYWKKDQLYQLPISWFTGLHHWTTSPGYPSGMPFFDRPVLERCFECHTSFITPPAGQNVYALDSTSLIVNIDCERCHGPAANHVAYHTEFPGEKVGRYIVSYRSLTRRQKIDLCATCHAGSNTIQLRSIFGFRPGDSLVRYVVPAHIPVTRPDVHGDQIALLAASKCFRMSEMDCSTCHDPHVNDHDDWAAYAQRCQGCHSPANHNFCTIADDRNTAVLKTNCTRCHMPAQPSDIIKVRTGAAPANTAIYMINHRIAVYPEESRRILDSFMRSAASSQMRQPSSPISQMRQPRPVRSLKRIASTRAQLPPVYPATAADIKDIKSRPSETTIGGLTRRQR